MLHMVSYQSIFRDIAGELWTDVGINKQNIKKTNIPIILLCNSIYMGRMK
jgi:hypothetical protein